MTEPTLPEDLADTAADVVEAAALFVTVPVPKRTMSTASIVAIALAICGGIVLTGLLMTAGTAAHDRPTTSAVARPVVSTPKASAATTAVILDSASAPKWTSSHHARWAGTARKTAVFEVAAERPVAVWSDTVTPRLVVRCMDQRTDVFVYIETAARIEAEDENHAVHLVFDDEAGTDARWPDSVEHDALFAPDGARLAERLMSAGTLRFGFTPHNAAPVTAIFDVRGLAERMAPVAKFCGGL
jgi:hypothetical protein